MKYALIDGGKISNIVEWDGIGDVFASQQAIEIVSDAVSIGFTYEDGKFIGPENGSTVVGLIEQMQQQKELLISIARQEISIPQTKLMIGRTLSSAETAHLNAWMDYIDILQAVDTAASPDVNWPAPPAF